MEYDWSFDPLVTNTDLLLRGIAITILLTALSMALALVIGFVVAVAIEYGSRPVRVLAVVYAEFFRALPLLVLIFWVFLVLPVLTGWTLSPFASGLLAFTLNVSAFVTEAFRAGLVSVAPGLRQAGLALGMTQGQLIRRVIWPIAWRRTLPIVGSIWVGLFKDSALVSLIQVHDLMFEGRVIANKTFRYLEVYTVVALLYYVISWPQARLVDRLFARFRIVE
jgi:His/Glu/Gln/Arg/opine family amino acid ABC transporter permease subunit